MEIVVVGAGQMGAGIAQVAAQHGHTVLLNDRDGALIERGIASIRKNLDRAVEKSRITAMERDDALAKIRATPKLEHFTAQIAIEAATENLETKLDLLAVLDASLPSQAILASNTSSISITRLASATRRPQRVIGMHFMNPVPVMPLVEIVRGLETSDETCDAVRALAEQLGKTPVEVRDFPGFVSNRILLPMINEAIYALYEGVASAEAIDAVMKLGMNHPMGPLALADLIGLDTCLSVMQVLHDGFGDSKYRPCPLLAQYVAAGRLGRKSGRGFYDYP
ncbi:MAG TPA: 3-hydroxybutyryl-CoA dehydrogenase [Candidatus Dormibacteraeota bacterium]|nr:3-hydroxybutyryl-CoA dehydrogenase [Candidatus Dormibacteraeota bacterium]